MSSDAVIGNRGASSLDFGDNSIRKRPDRVLNVGPLLFFGSKIDTASPSKNSPMLRRKARERPFSRGILGLNITGDDTAPDARKRQNGVARVPVDVLNHCLDTADERVDDVCPWNGIEDLRRGWPSQRRPSKQRHRL